MAIRIVYLAVCMSASTCTGLAQALPFDPTLLRDAAQDGTGRAWAIGRERGLYFWQDGKWQEEELALPDTARPLLLQTNYQGEVFVLCGSGGYQAAEAQYWITRARGNRSPVSASWRACMAGASMSFQPDGTGWLAAWGPRYDSGQPFETARWVAASEAFIYRITPDLTPERAYTIHSNQMAGVRFDYANPVESSLDGEGRVLFWGRRQGRELATLRGLLIASKDGFAHYPEIEGLPNDGFASLVMLDGFRLWASLPYWDGRGGLYELDLKAMHGGRVAEPEPGAFSTIMAIFAAGTDRYVASRDPRNLARHTLWRWRTGAWEKVHSTLVTPAYGFEYQVLKPIANGSWVGMAGSGLVFIPPTTASPAEEFDWRQGQPLESIHRIFPLASGELLLVGFDQGTTHAFPQELRRARSISPRVVDVWKTEGNLQRDQGRHLWTLWSPSTAEASLGEWDGAQWKYYRLPAHVAKQEVHSVGLDSVGRFWLPYREWFSAEGRRVPVLTEKAEVYVPQDAKWLHYDSCEEAFADSVASFTHFQVEYMPGRGPDFGPGNQVCFLATDWQSGQRVVHFYNSQSWRHWDLASVGYSQPGWAGEPFFTSDGKLAINLSLRYPSHRMTRLFDGEAWIDVPFRSAGGRDPLVWRSLPRIAGRAPASEAADLAGGKWSAANQQLFHSALGLSAPQFDLTDVHPFIGARRVNQIWEDAKGNIVLHTTLPAFESYAPGQYVVLAPKQSMPDSHLDLVRISSRGAELRFTPGDGNSAVAASSQTSAAGMRAPSFTEVELQNGQIILRWSGPGILQSAAQLDGPWTDIPQASSQYAVSITKPAEFYRIRH